MGEFYLFFRVRNYPHVRDTRPAACKVFATVLRTTLTISASISLIPFKLPTILSLTAVPTALIPGSLIFPVEDSTCSDISQLGWQTADSLRGPEKFVGTDGEG
jgi:hypothetical protein